MFAFRRQPVRTIYLLYESIATVVVRIPFWFFYYALRFNRQRPTWTLKRSIIVSLIKLAQKIGKNAGALTSHPTYLKLELGPDIEGVWVHPAPTSAIRGQVATWAYAAKVEPIRLPGYWYGPKPEDPPKHGDKVFYCLHGGSYTSLSAHPKNMAANIPHGLIKHTSVKRAFAIEYRLSSTEPFEKRAPFPTALIDALAGYIYLIERGYDASDIIVEGDSAGGNLALALTRYLVENQGEGLPHPPGALILLSPWCDLSRSHERQGGSPFWETDVLEPANPKKPYWAIGAVTGPHGMGSVSVNPYISPASYDLHHTVSFKGFPRTFITAGGAEILHDQITTLKERMEKDTDVTFYLAPDAVHDWVVMRFHEPERTHVLKTIAKWIWH